MGIPGNIQMVDLHRQYLQVKEELDAAIHNVIDSTAFIKGKPVYEFQDALSLYLEIPFTVACGNGTDALQAALMALDLQQGDEVITTPFTFIATVEVIRLLGLKPVLVDVDRETFNLDPAKLHEVLTPRSRVIIPIHLFGQCAPMEEIMKFAREHSLVVIEDNAQALGAEYLFSDGSSRKAGTIGDMGTTSFFPSKNLGAFGDGGAIFTRDESLNQRLSAVVNHGMKKRYFYDFIGMNSRLDTLQAAILLVKLKYLDAYHKARQDAASRYDHLLSDIPEIRTPFRAAFSTHVFHQYTLRVEPESRDKLKDRLKERQIPSMIYYPVPIHLQAAYRDLGYGEGDFQVSERLCREVLSLPIHTELSEEQLSYISDQIHHFFAEFK